MFTLLAAAALALTSPAASLPEATTTDELSRAEALLEKQDCAGAKAIVAQVRIRPSFAAAPDAQQRAAYGVDVVCSAKARDWKAAFSAARASNALPNPTPHMLGLEVGLAANAGDGEAALEALERAAPYKAAALGAFGDDVIYLVGRQAREAGPEANFRFLAALYAAEYRPKYPFSSPDHDRVEYAILLAERGDTEAAVRIADRIELPVALAKLAVDRNFAADAEANPQRYDLKAAAEAALVTHRREMATKPRALSGVIAAADDLRMLGRPSEALDLLEQALARMEAAKKEPAFEDAKEHLPWLHNARAYALEELGRPEEAAAAFELAVGLKDYGGANTSQRINFALFQVAHGQPQAALKLVAGLGSSFRASGYGRMLVWTSRACAYAQLGRKAELDQTLVEVREHFDDNPSAASHALLCAGDEAAAAASYVARLSRVDQRHEALITFSRFQASPARTPFRLELRRRLEAVAARPEVAAAIARAGRPVEAPLVVPNWGDI